TFAIASSEGAVCRRRLARTGQGWLNTGPPIRRFRDYTRPMTVTERAGGPAGSPAPEPPTFRHFIAGEWCDSTSGATFESHNPADSRDVIGRFQQGTAADVGMAIRAAYEASRLWQRTPAPKRGEILYRFGALLAEHKERISRAMTREMGKVIAEARGDVQ